MTTQRKRGSAGFTLIELLVVVLIIGILAAIAVPQYFKVVEKGKAAEATQWITNVMQAQETYLAQWGVYASNITQLAVGVQSSLNNFDPISTFAVGGGAGVSPSWGVTLNRGNQGTNSSIPVGGYYGAYQIIWTGPPGNWQCAGGNNSAACQADLLPQ